MKGTRDDWYRGGFDADTYETTDEERWRAEQRYRCGANPAKPHPEDRAWFSIAALVLCFAAVFGASLYALGVI